VPLPHGNIKKFILLRKPYQITQSKIQKEMLDAFLMYDTIRMYNSTV